MSEQVKLVENWLLESGIQNDNIKKEDYGSFNSWLDLDQEKYVFIYSEITGYGITTLLYLNSYLNDPALINRAKSAAAWLKAYALHPSGGILTRKYIHNKDNDDNYSFFREIIHSFDTGMVLNGIVYLYKLTHEECYLQLAEKIVFVILSKMMNNDGSICAIYDAKADKIIDNSSKWSTFAGSFHAKLVIGIVELYEIKKELYLKDAVVRLCDFAMTKQVNSGRFSSSGEIDWTHLHAHSYSAEGLLYAGIKLKNPTYIESALRATEWVLKNQLSNGGIPSVYINDEFNSYERSDILAQTLRLGSLLNSLGYLADKYLINLAELRTRLLSFQLTNTDQKGGFLYGSTRDGAYLNCVNSWCSMFSLQSLKMYEDLSTDGKIPLEPLFFV